MLKRPRETKTPAEILHIIGNDKLEIEKKEKELLEIQNSPVYQLGMEKILDISDQSKRQKLFSELDHLGGEENQIIADIKKINDDIRYYEAYLINNEEERERTLRRVETSFTKEQKRELALRAEIKSNKLEIQRAEETLKQILKHPFMTGNIEETPFHLFGEGKDANRIGSTIFFALCNKLQKLQYQIERKNKQNESNCISLNSEGNEALKKLAILREKRTKKLPQADSKLNTSFTHIVKRSTELTEKKKNGIETIQEILLCPDIDKQISGATQYIEDWYAQLDREQKNLTDLEKIKTQIPQLFMSSGDIEKKTKHFIELLNPPKKEVQEGLMSAEIKKLLSCENPLVYCNLFIEKWCHLVPIDTQNDVKSRLTALINAAEEQRTPKAHSSRFFPAGTTSQSNAEESEEELVKKPQCLQQ